ncbi:hybrid sensor histidine kinase/response regulator [Pseudoalteromonas umbrosa]|uniref:hybrid sensor histidine kinase/response regulator n=1 Tax=Pseudoalteromonas umbrosa TaxID=3048489 RepID=UPI0024C3E095|nr:ATP-binding protein [Pseudoalteromonas sp. B95]MDK1286697.1 ATP-binding protein [Pseudoalteromonas sp. B95]
MSFLRQFHNIVSKQELSTEEKIQALLRFGLDVFDLEIAIVSQVTDNKYTIVYVESDSPSLTPKCQFDLEGTYCTHTLKANKALSFHHAGSSSIASHPCYQNFQLESYIGAPIHIANQTFGTINFSAAKISNPFTTEHIDYVELFAQWLGCELARMESESKFKINYKTLAKMEQVASMGSWRIDIYSNQVFWSDEAKRIHQLELDSTLSLNEWFSLINEDVHRQAFSSAIDNALNNGLPWELELQVTTKLNKEIWVSCHGEKTIDQDGEIYLIGSLQNITKDVELRRNLQQQKLDAEKLLNERSLLLAKISHEMRTPLNGINGMLLSALDETDKNKITEHLQLALRSTDILTGLVNEILDFSKISQEGLSLTHQACNISPLIEDLVDLSKQLASNKGIDFSSDIKLPKTCWVTCDPLRLNQIITNLISNAVKFTEYGGVSLKVHSQSRSDGVDLFINVNDTGIGMSPTSIQYLFEPFKQGEDEVGSHFGGTGLGMSIVKELIDLMQGTIDITSAMQKGSQFRVFIPLKLAPKPAIKKPLKQHNFDASSLNVLVVEDNLINLKVMKVFLNKFNIAPHTASNGEIAIKQCELNKYDIIFMDSMMPVMDGLTAAKIIFDRKLLPHHAPIIAMTANTDELSKRHLSEVGMTDMLPKPIDFMTLGNLLSKCLESMPLNDT